MTTEGWIFMVGFRVFDVGLLIIWLVWFFRLRDDEDDSPEDDGGGGGPDPGSGGDGPGGGGIRLPLGRAPQGNARLRGQRRPGRSPRRRGTEPVPRPLPARVRRPRSPAPAHRRAAAAGAARVSGPVGFTS
jgi:hypothetical protein